MNGKAIKQDGLVCAYRLDGKGGGEALDWDAVRKWKPRDGMLWVHLDRHGAEARKWLSEDSDVDPAICQALLASESRPRVLAVGEALLVIMRGVNLNPGAQPDDMVALRLWIDGKRVISLRHRKIMAIDDLRKGIAAGQGPTDAGDFLVQIADRLLNRIAPVISGIDDRVDALEESVLTAESAALRGELAEVRHATIGLRRYLAPQRDAMSRLMAERTPWLEDIHRAFLREIADRTTRHVEDLDGARERAAVTHDELQNRLSEQMNKTMYLLTIVAALLLPPSLVTGLFGINVGGMPGLDHPWAFAIVAAIVVGMVTAEYLLLRHLKWI